MALTRQPNPERVLSQRLELARDFPKPSDKLLANPDFAQWYKALSEFWQQTHRELQDNQAAISRAVTTIYNTANQPPP